ncbi:MAG: cytochrome c oxidase accessory protein CcoG [Bacteroidetes bacterium]|nr:MAG: cytochrome c oxidase accessory protein CcoG [Bacteroidota bacterium]
MKTSKDNELHKHREHIAHDPNYDDISYRDRISTVKIDGSRNYLFPKLPKGKFINWRNIFGVSLLIMLFAFPLIKINGDPIILLNIIDRQFIIFGVIFWPQDTFVLLLMMLSFLLFIILFTVTYGRIWCGWACPQTIFLEIIFRRIEKWIDGTPNQQRKLAEMPWNVKKISKRLFKWTIFYTISFILVNAMLWYFMSFDKWLLYAGEMDKHISGIGLIFIFTTVFFAIYTWFREQICIIACPYGRMQSVLMDRSTIVISYDYLRGEPRGFQKKGSTREDTGKGDCIDCHACVDVCPTGIDIRNGTQLECVNCTACIDACDNIMTKVDKPKGLIRYASENEIAEGKKQTFSIRTVAYSIVLLGLLAFFLTVLLSRADVDATIQRVPGTLFQKDGNDSISNIYNIKVVNKTRSEQTLTLKLKDSKGHISVAGGALTILPKARTKSVVILKLAEKDITTKNFSLDIDILLDGKSIDETRVTFIGDK